MNTELKILYTFIIIINIKIYNMNYFIFIKLFLYSWRRNFFPSFFFFRQYLKANLSQKFLLFRKPLVFSVKVKFDLNFKTYSSIRSFLFYPFLLEAIFW